MSFLSPRQEAEIGAAKHSQILRDHFGELDNPELGAYVAGVGNRIAAESASAGTHFRFTVLNSPDPNAFAMAGGYIYITRGLLALLGSEAELAGILGHEVGHIVARHSAESVSREQLMRQGSNPFLAGKGTSGLSETRRAYLGKYNREQEHEADNLGVNYTARAGYDPFAPAKGLASIALFHGTMLRISGRSAAELEASMTHPSTPERVQRAVRIASATRIKSGSRPRYERRYLAAIDGMSMGPRPGQGRVVGQTYFQSDPGLAFDVPGGFRANQTAGQFLARGPAGVIIKVSPTRVEQGLSTRSLLNSSSTGSSRISVQEEYSVSGMEAVAGAASFQLDDGTVTLSFVAIRFSPEIIYFFQLHDPNKVPGAKQTFEKMVRSFRKVSASDAPAQRTMRLRVHTLAADKSAEEVSRMMPTADHKLDLFLALNALPKGARLKAGDQVKLLRLE